MTLTKEELNYDIDALKGGIVKCKRNIDVFKKAIRDEHKTISQYRYIISELEKKQ